MLLENTMKNGHISQIKIAVRLLAIIIFISVFVAQYVDPAFGKSLSPFWAIMLTAVSIGYFLSIWLESRDDSKSPTTRALWLVILLLQLLPILALFLAGMLVEEGGLGLIVIFGVLGLPLVSVGFIVMIVSDTKTLLVNRKQKDLNG